MADVMDAKSAVSFSAMKDKRPARVRMTTTSILLCAGVLLILSLGPSSMVLKGVARADLQAVKMWEQMRQARGTSVLVLGSGGVIGRALVKELQRQEFPVLEVPGRSFLDLRYEEAMEYFANESIAFAFVLLADSGTQGFYGHAPSISRHNQKQMMQNVLRWLGDHGINFFLSSWLWEEYIGERGFGNQKLQFELDAIKTGKVVRLPLVFGSSHNGNDFVNRIVGDCLQSGRSFPLVQRTSRLLYAEEVSIGLVGAMRNYSDLPKVTEIVNSEKVSAKAVASVIRRELEKIGSESGCIVTFNLTEGTNVWKSRYLPKNSKQRVYLAGDLQQGVRGVVDTHVQERERATTTAARSPGPPYVTVVLAGRNDNYKKHYYQRLYNSLRTFAESARRYELQFEILFAQYDPDPDVLPISFLLPWTNAKVYENLKVLTVPKKRDSDRHFLEFYAKNVAARRSTSPFVLFTNADNVFSPWLVRELAKGNLNPRAIYRAHREESAVFDVNLPHTDVLHQCRRKAPTDISALKRVARYLHRPFWHACGDFTLIARERLFARRGYPEIDSNNHVDSLGLRNFFCPLFPETVQIMFEEPICHQSHSKRLVRTLNFTAVKEVDCSLSEDLQRRYQLREDWGAPTIEVETASLASIYDAGFNALSPYRTYRHHPVFRSFEQVHWRGPLGATAPRNFLGYKPRASPCTGNATSATPWREVGAACARYLAMSNMGVAEVMGELPLMDEDYFVWIALLQAADPSVWKEDFIAVEYGSESGFWAMQALLAAQLRMREGGSVRATAIVAKASNPSHRDEQARLNNLTNDIQLQLHGHRDHTAHPLAFVVVDTANASVEEIIHKHLFSSSPSTRICRLVLFIRKESEFSHLELAFNSAGGWKTLFAFRQSPEASPVTTEFGPIYFTKGLLVLEGFCG